MTVQLGNIVTTMNEWADFWRNHPGINVIPADSKNKKPKVTWKKWQDNPIPQEIHDEWKETGMFTDGMAIICGRCWHKEGAFPIWFNLIDADNQLGISEFVRKTDGTDGTIQEMAEKTLVEQHVNKNKAHFYYTSDEPYVSIPALTGDKKEKSDANLLPAIEVKSGGNLLSYCAPGPHKDGSAIEIVGVDTVATVYAKNMNAKIDAIRKKYGIVGSSVDSLIKPSITDVVRRDLKVIAGQNRHEAVMRFAESLHVRNPDMPREFVELNTRWFNQNYTTDPLDDSELEGLIDQGIGWIDQQAIGEADSVKFENFNSGMLGETKPENAAHWLAEFFVTKQKMIEKSKVSEKLCRWKAKLGCEFNVSKVVDSVFEKDDVHFSAKQTAYEYGTKKLQQSFENKQTEEAAYWIMGRFHIKRIGITGEMLFFDDRHYQYDAQYMIRRAAREILFKSTNSKVNEIVSLIEDSAEIIKGNEIEKWLHLVCLKNGIYDVITGKFTAESNPEWIILNQIPHEYDETRTFHDISNLVSDIINDEKNVQSFYDFMSICLYPEIGIYKQLGMPGPPGTGKTELCKLQYMVFGEDNVSHAPIHQVARDNTTQNDIAFKMLNIDADLNSESIEKIDTIKKWVTRDPLTTRSIYAHNTTYRPTARLMFAANALYEITRAEDADAIYDRTHLIDIKKRFRGTDVEVKDIMKKTATKNELTGLLSYLLKNATELYKLQDMHYPIDSPVIAEKWDKHAKGIKQFVAKWIVKDIHVKCIRSSVHDSWMRFCQENGIARKGRTKFYEDFEEVVGVECVFTRIDDIPAYVYHGIRLRSLAEVKQNEQKGVDEFC